MSKSNPVSLEQNLGTAPVSAVAAVKAGALDAAPSRPGCPG